MGAEVSTGALKNPPAKEEDYSDDMSDFLCCLYRLKEFDHGNIRPLGTTVDSSQTSTDHVFDLSVQTANVVCSTLPPVAAPNDVAIENIALPATHTIDSKEFNRSLDHVHPTPDQEYSTPGAVYAASLAGDALAVQEALEAGDSANEDDWDKKTALIVASEKGFVDVVGVLLAAGADVNARDVRGWAPLHWAAWNGHVSVVASLLADPRVQPNVARNDGKTPLDLARDERQDAVAALLEVAKSSRCS